MAGGFHSTLPSLYKVAFVANVTSKFPSALKLFEVKKTIYLLFWGLMMMETEKGLWMNRMQRESLFAPFLIYDRVGTNTIWGYFIPSTLRMRRSIILKTVSFQYIRVLEIVVLINRNLVKLLVVKDNVWEPNMGWRNMQDVDAWSKVMIIYWSMLTFVIAFIMIKNFLFYRVSKSILWKRWKGQDFINNVL